MNILFLTNSCVDPTKGGVQKITYSLAVSFRKRANVVYIISLRKNGKKVDENQFFLPDAQTVSSIENISFLSEFVKTNKISVIINQQGISIDFINLLSAIPRTFEIVSVMHNSLLTHIRNFYYIHEYHLKKIHLNYLLSFTKKKIIRSALLKLYYLLYKERIIKIVSNSDKVVMLSDRLTEELSFFLSCSNIDLLLDIWKLLYKYFPDWELDIVGGDDMAICSLNRIITQSKIERVNLVGFADPTKYYERASIYCMTSCAESFGMVLIEAMSFGVTPIAFNSYPAIMDIIDSEINGVLINGMNVNSYANQLSLLMKEEKRRMGMAQNAIAKSYTFDENVVMPKWNDLLKI